MGDCGHPPPPTCHSLLIDFHHEVWVIQEPGIFSEVLIGDHVLVELLWAQRQRVRADTAMSHIICPIPSYRPPVGQVVDLATHSPSCGFYTCSHSRIYRLTIKHLCQRCWLRVGTTGQPHICATPPSKVFPDFCCLPEVFPALL